MNTGKDMSGGGNIVPSNEPTGENATQTDQSTSSAVFDQDEYYRQQIQEAKDKLFAVCSSYCDLWDGVGIHVVSLNKLFQHWLLTEYKTEMRQNRHIEDTEIWDDTIKSVSDTIDFVAKVADAVDLVKLYNRSIKKEVSREQ